jgi:hypothetical protein
MSHALSSGMITDRFGVEKVNTAIRHPFHWQSTYSPLLYLQR